MQAKLVRAGASGRVCWRGGAPELVARGSARAGCAASTHASGGGERGRGALDASRPTRCSASPGGALHAGTRSRRAPRAVAAATRQLFFCSGWSSTRANSAAARRTADLPPPPPSHTPTLAHTHLHLPRARAGAAGRHGRGQVVARAALLQGAVLRLPGAAPVRARKKKKRGRCAARALFAPVRALLSRGFAPLESARSQIENVGSVFGGGACMHPRGLGLGGPESFAACASPPRPPARPARKGALRGRSLQRRPRRARADARAARVEADVAEKPRSAAALALPCAAAACRPAWPAPDARGRSRPSAQRS